MAVCAQHGAVCERQRPSVARVRLQPNDRSMCQMHTVDSQRCQHASARACVADNTIGARSIGQSRATGDTFGQHTAVQYRTHASPRHRTHRPNRADRSPQELCVCITCVSRRNVGSRIAADMMSDMRWSHGARGDHTHLYALSTATGADRVRMVTGCAGSVVHGEQCEVYCTRGVCRARQRCGGAR